LRAARIWTSGIAIERRRITENLKSDEEELKEPNYLYTGETK